MRPSPPSRPRLLPLWGSTPAPALFDTLGFGYGPALTLAVAALESLGYQAVEIREVLADVPTDASVEEQVRSALQALGNR